MLVDKSVAGLGLFEVVEGQVQCTCTSSVLHVFNKSPVNVMCYMIYVIYVVYVVYAVPVEHTIKVLPF